MSCKHEHLKAVGDVIYCTNCKEEVPIEFLMARNGTEKAEKPAEEARPDKSTSRKRTAKKAV